MYFQPLSQKDLTVTETSFVKTSRINHIAGNLIGDPNNPDWAALERQINLIQSELDEAKDSLAKRDIETLRDDVGDVLFTAYGLGHRAGFPVDEDFGEVCRSNMTKFDSNEDDAVGTVLKYEKIGVEARATPKVVIVDGVTKTFYVTHSTKDQTGTDGRSYPGGKWLKSFRFEEPVYSNLSTAEA
jgi:predicted HAD superfamily Cof-like phosphohydrolase